MAESELPAESRDDIETLTRTKQWLFRRSYISQFGPLDSPDEWVWHGYFAKNQMVLLTGQWKVGKTTLLAALLGKLGTGGELAGRAVRPSRAVVITGESIIVWSKRMLVHDIGDAVSFVFTPFEKPIMPQWQDLIADIADQNRKQPIDLLVIDPFIAIAPATQRKTRSR